MHTRVGILVCVFFIICLIIRLIIIFIIVCMMYASLYNTLIVSQKQHINTKSNKNWRIQAIIHIFESTI